MADDLVKILDGNTFVVSDSRGDIEASLTDPTGLFSFDTRFLSKWVLTINGDRLNPLSVDDMQYFESRFFLVPGHRNRLRRREVVGDPAPVGRRRISRGAHRPQSRQRAGQARDPHRRGLRLRRPVRGQGRAAEEGQESRTRVERSQLVLGVHPRHVPAVHDHRRERAREVRREGSHLLGHDPGARRMANDDRRDRRTPDRSRRPTNEPAAGRSPTCNAISIAGSKPRPR